MYALTRKGWFQGDLVDSTNAAFPALSNESSQKHEKQIRDFLDTDAGTATPHLSDPHLLAIVCIMLYIPTTAYDWRMGIGSALIIGEFSACDDVKSCVAV